MSIKNLHVDVLVLLMVSLAILWIISLYLAFVFVLVSTSIFKFLSIMLLITEIFIGAATVWLLITITGGETE